jgi:RNA polymerase-binding transcription factor DksA
MANTSQASKARKVLLRRGRSMLRLRADALGDGTAAADGTPDFLAGLSDTERAELAEIHAALERIERGIFGRCEHCSEVIEAARIDATPWVRTCSRCEGAAHEVAPAPVA